MSTDTLKRLKPILRSLSTMEENYIEAFDDLDLDLGLADDTFCSGWVCMMFMLSLPAKLPEIRDRIDWGEVYDKNIAYIKLYLLVDHYMDSTETTHADRASLIKWLLDDDRVETEEIHKKILLPFKVLTSTEEDKAQMRILIKVTVDGIKLQRKNDVSYKEYHKAAVDKGGYTVLVGARLIYGKVLDVLTDEELLFLGGATQLLDDMIDTSEDTEAGINTLCTYSKKVDGNVDRVAKDLLTMINKLPPQFSHYQKSMLFAIRYHVVKSRHYSYSFKTKMIGNSVMPDPAAFKRRKEKKFRKMYKQRHCSDSKCESCGK